MNYAGVVMSPMRRRIQTVDAGRVVRRARVGVPRGQTDIPHNINMRGIRLRIDTTRLP
jgi:hypothetical protein